MVGKRQCWLNNVLRSVGKASIHFDLHIRFLPRASWRLLRDAHFPGIRAPFIVKQCGIYLAGGGVYSGPCFPALFSYFKGRKGVLTSAALILIIDWSIF